MTSKSKIYGDFNNADRLGRIRLLESSQEDIARLGIVLKDGMKIEVDDGEGKGDGAFETLDGGKDF